jgi:hypothetical protein
MNQCIYKSNTTDYITPVNTGYTPQTREQNSPLSKTNNQTKTTAQTTLTEHQKPENKTTALQTPLLF